MREKSRWKQIYRLRGVFVHIHTLAAGICERSALGGGVGCGGSSGEKDEVEQPADKAMIELD